MADLSPASTWKSMAEEACSGYSDAEDVKGMDISPGQNAKHELNGEPYSTNDHSHSYSPRGFWSGMEPMQSMLLLTPYHCSFL